MYPSVAAVIVCVAMGVGHTHGAATDDFKMKMKTIAGECATETKGNPDSFVKAWNTNTLPDTEADKCFLACMMKKYGVLADGKVNIDIMNSLNKQRWSDAGDVEKADKINADCVKEVKIDEKDDCMSAHKLLECAFQKSEEAGIHSSVQKEF